MKGFSGDLEQLTSDNSNYRQVLYTGQNLQLVLMSLMPGDQMGDETHAVNDQFLRFEKGVGVVWINDVAHRVKSDSGVMIPAGARHNVVNVGPEPLRFQKVYGPPVFADGTTQPTKADADAFFESFDSRTTE